MEYIGAIYLNADSVQFKLPDTVVTDTGTGGAIVGDKVMDGNIPGCAGHSGYVVVEVRAKYEPK
jgi:hypothetical protein